MELRTLDLTCTDYCNECVNNSVTDAQIMLSRYTGSYQTVEDAINIVAIQNTPRYESSLYDAVEFLEPYVNAGIQSGVIGIDTDTFELSSVLRSGFIRLIEEKLFFNLENIIFNYLSEAASANWDVSILDRGTPENEELANQLEAELMNVAKEVAKYSYTFTFSDLDDKVFEIVATMLIH